MLGAGTFNNFPPSKFIIILSFHLTPALNSKKSTSFTHFNIKIVLSTCIISLLFDCSLAGFHSILLAFYLASLFSGYVVRTQKLIYIIAYSLKLSKFLLFFTYSLSLSGINPAPFTASLFPSLFVSHSNFVKHLKFFSLLIILHA